MKLADLAMLTESQQIKIIGETAASGNKTGFIVRNDEKIIARYIDRLARDFAGLKVTRLGPVKGGFALCAELNQSN